MDISNLAMEKAASFLLDAACFNRFNKVEKILKFFLIIRVGKSASILLFSIEAQDFLPLSPHQAL